LNALDPATILFMTMAMAAAMSVVLFSAHRSFPTEVSGLGHWALGLAGIVLAAVMFALRQRLPFQLGHMGSGIFLLGSIGPWLAGTRRFYGLTAGWPAIAVAMFVNAASLLWWVNVHPDFAARAAVFSCLAGLFYLAQFFVVARHGERHFSSYALAALLLLQAVAVFARAVAIMRGGLTDGELTHPGAVPAMYLAMANFMVLLLAVAFMGVATRRLQRVLEQRSNQDPLT